MMAKPAGACVQDRSYVRARIKESALRALADRRKALNDSVKLVDGFTYYDRVKTEHGVVSGLRCTYLGEGRKSAVCWSKFSDSLRKLKVMEVLAHGSDEDFCRIYVDLSDGRTDVAAKKFVLEHVTGSSEKALDEMEAYCDSRWEGPWPWQVRAPRKFRDIVRENEEMNKARILEMRTEYEGIRSSLYEGEVEQTQVIIKGREVVDNIADMITKLGKITAEAMTTLKDEVRSAYGEQIARDLEQTSNEHVGAAVDALSALKSSMEDKVKEMEEQIGSDPLSSDLDDLDDMYSGDEEMGGDDDLGAGFEDGGLGDDEDMGPSERPMRGDQKSEKLEPAKRGKK